VTEKRPWWILVGGRSRLGRVLAESLAKSERLVLTSSRPWIGEDHWLDELSIHAQVRTFQWDADDPDLLSTMMADMKCLGDAGIILGNAVVVAGTFPRQPLGSWDPGALEATWRRNLSFPLLAAQSLGSRLEAGGCLQFLLDSAIHHPFPQRLPYSAAKAGLAALVPALAAQWAPRVRVVGHALGTVLPSPDSDPPGLVENSLLKRIGEPADLLRALRYVAESPYLTGEILTLDGGSRWR